MSTARGAALAATSGNRKSAPRGNHQEDGTGHPRQAVHRSGRAGSDETTAVSSENGSSSQTRSRAQYSTAFPDGRAGAGRSDWSAGSIAIDSRIPVEVVLDRIAGRTCPCCGATTSQARLPGWPGVATAAMGFWCNDPTIGAMSRNAALRCTKRKPRRLLRSIGNRGFSSRSTEPNRSSEFSKTNEKPSGRAR